MKEHETKVNVEGNGEQFDNSAIEEMGVQLKKLENSRKGAQGQVESLADSIQNGRLYRDKVNHAVSIEVKLKSRIPVAIKNIDKVRQKLNLRVI